ncbi:12242_t:CDS:2, partial [Entrophospora sp. SA101]
QIVKHRKWEVNGTITPDQYNKYFVVEPKLDKFIDKIKDGEYLLLYGPCASGKSTRIMYAMQKLQEEGYHCIYLDFTKTNLNNDLKAMWISFYRLMKPQCHAGIVNNEFNQMLDFVETFYKEKWDRKVILFLDEFDRIYHASDEICDDCLSAIHSLKNDKRYHIMHSVVAAGPFSIQYLNPKGNYTSPFNAVTSFPNPNFTKEEVANLYQDYSSSININIDASIISDIYNKTNGHVGLVCLCGHAIDEDLICNIGQNNILDLDSWIVYCSNELQNRIIQYPTFTKMFQNVILGDIDHANFFASEGALQPHKDPDKFKISSPLIRALILQCVIPSVYPDHPKVDVPYKDGILDTINVLKEAVRVFDQDIISLGFQRSFKTAKNYVDDKKKQHVPCEKGETHQYPDFVITENNKNSIIVIELVATALDNDLKNHFRTTMEYTEKLKANEAWVVHFTCADNVIEKPTCPIEQEQKDKLHIVHFWHDISFKSVQMTAHFPNGEIINEI